MRQQRNLREVLFWTTPRIVVESLRDGDVVSPLPRPDIGSSLILASGQIGFEKTMYLATARHVVENAEDGSVIFLRSHPEKLGKAEPKVFEFRRKRFSELWYYPRDSRLDVAITPLSFGELGKATNDVAITVLPLTRGINHFVDANLAFTHNFEELLFSGYPEGLWDPETGFPIVRRAVTATPLKSDYRGDAVFLIDGAVHHGCSGGPVLVIDKKLVAPPQVPNPSWLERVREEDRFAFVGMIIETIPDPETRESRLSLGKVLKAHKLFEVVHEYERLTGRAP
ncbi:MAG TPA: trypsin-like peptidase domain-containing protein [Thermoanaerobaculia bacterium]|jgi:hypothetical protein|nr:trypsin-like peptidase domain-containing protein [Thermoanaerobaculia bacterium]